MCEPALCPTNDEVVEEAKEEIVYASANLLL